MLDISSMCEISSCVGAPFSLYSRTAMRFLHMIHCYVAFEIQGLEDAGGAMMLFGVEEDWTG